MSTAAAAQPTTTTISTDQLHAYIAQVTPQYQWSLTTTNGQEEAKVHSPATTTAAAPSKSSSDRPLPKKQELPESDSSSSSSRSSGGESSKWLLVMKDEEDDESAVLETKEIRMEENAAFPSLLARNKAALGEWLLNIHSEF